MNRLHLASGVALLALAGSWQPAFAQENGVDIIVTARRVEERLQDVPISITVFNQQQLTNRNIVSAGDLATYTPSLSANSRFGSENTSFAIRGFVQDNGTAPSVAVYFADVVALRASGGTTFGNGAGPGALFDLQNLQVLKGPQGTLFGRNTTGGAVLLVPQKPTGQLEGYVETSIGNYNLRRFQAVVNVPVTDTLRIRLGIDRNTRDGYLNNYSGIGPKDFADSDYWAVRASVVADLTPNLENYFVGTFSDSDTNGFLPKVFACNTLSVSAPIVDACAQVSRQEARGDFYGVDNTTIAPRQHIRQWQLINTTTWRATDALTIKNVASYGEFRQSFRAGVYGENLILTAGPNAGRSVTQVLSTPFPGRSSASQSTFTDELQFQGNLGERVSWQTGAYLELSEPLGFSGSQSPSQGICDDPNPLLCTSALAPGGYRAVSASGRSNKQRFTDVGVYTQATYKFTDQFSVTGGIRYTWDYTKAVTRNINYAADASGRLTNALAGLGTCPGSAVLVTEADCENVYTQRASRPTWLIGVDFKPADDVLLYAKYARGYRAGGLKTDAIAFASFDPEKVDTYEVGAKTSWTGPIRGTFNVSAYYNDFSNQQFSGSATPKAGNPNPTPPQIIVNAGQSRIYGVEVEGSLTPFAGFTVDGSYAYLNTKLKSITTPADTSPLYTPPTPSGALAGRPLSLAPRNKFSVTASYLLPLAESVGKISLGATFTHIDSMISTVQDSQTVLTSRGLGALYTAIGRDLGILPGLNLLNLNVNWRSVAGSPVDLSFFATNVTKEKYYASVFGGLPSFGFEAAAVGEPRTYGVRVKYRFGR